MDALGLGTFAVFERCAIARLGQLQEVASRPLSGARDTGTRLFDHRCFGVASAGAPSAQGAMALSDHIGQRKET